MNGIDQLASLDHDAVVVDALLAVVAIVVEDAAPMAEVCLADVPKDAVLVDTR